MNSLLRVARRCRELMASARNNAAVEQLRLWAEDLEQQAQALAPPARDTRQGISAQPSP